MRQFETGATRDKEDGKLDYEAFFSPAVLRRRAEYMHAKRIQPDGKYREGDNWQKLFGPHHHEVCMKSMTRHYMDVWLAHRGHSTDHDIEDSLCALMFNAEAYLYKLLLEKEKLMLKKL